MSYYYVGSWGHDSEQNSSCHNGFHFLIEDNLQEMQKKGKSDLFAKDNQTYNSKQKCIWYSWFKII